MALRLRVRETGAKLRVASDSFTLKASEGVPIYPNPYTGPTEVTPTEQVQVLPTSGLMMPGDVTVDAIDDEYVGSAIARQSELIVDGQTVMARAGYYANEVSETIPENTLVVTLSWQDDYFDEGEGAWVPDKTFEEIQAAAHAEKIITFTANGDGEEVLAEGEYYIEDEEEYFYYEVLYNHPQDGWVVDAYYDEGSGINYDGRLHDFNIRLQHISKTYTPTRATQHYNITPTSYYNGIDSVYVTINPIPSNYGLITWNGSTLTVS